MDNLRDIAEVKELRDARDVNALLSSGEWELLSVKAGLGEEGLPHALYVLGRPYREPEAPVTWL